MNLTIKYRHVLLAVLFVFSSQSFGSVIPAEDSGYPADVDLVSKHLLTRLYLSPLPGKRPLVLLLGGSNPWLSYPPGNYRIERLTKNGYHVLTAQYFLGGNHREIVKDFPEFPNRCENIHIDSFWDQISKYVAAHSLRIDADLIGVIGTSRGGELSLLLASHYPGFKFVVAIVPSGIVFQGSSISLPRQPTWLHNGEAIPFLSFNLFSWTTIKSAINWLYNLERDPSQVETTQIHLDAMAGQEAIENVAIKVEKINGPVLFISGDKDNMWPSTKLSDMAFNRLVDKKFPHLARNAKDSRFPKLTSHIVFRGADHFVEEVTKPNAWDLILEHLEIFVSYQKSLQK